MVPIGPLTRDEVWRMIHEGIDSAIKDYDGLNTRRHDEHNERFNWLQRTAITTLMTSVLTLAGIIATLLFALMHGSAQNLVK